MGNILLYCIKGTFKPTTMKKGIEYMMLADWYPKKFYQKVRILSNWWWNCWRFSMCVQCCTKIWKCMMYHLELFLPDFRFNNQLWFVFWRATNEKLLKTRHSDSKVYN
jgi:hypothetical protein